MSRSKITGVAVASIVAATALATPTDAALVTFSFSGEVTQVIDDFDLLGGEVGIGTPFFGEYTFESTTPDSQPLDPTFGEYLGAVTSLSGMVGEFPFIASGPMDIRISNDRFLNVTDFYGVTGDVLFAGSTLNFFIQLDDRSATALSSDALTPVAPPLALFNDATFGVFSQPILSVGGGVVSLVPEPGTLALLGLSGLLLLRRRVRNVMRCHACRRSAPEFHEA